MKRGDIYLVNFGQRYQSNIGKIRPAVIISADKYLELIFRFKYKTILVVPLTTQCSNNRNNLLRVFVSKRDKLLKDSEIIVNWACSVDYENLDIKTGLLTSLNIEETLEFDYKFSLFCDLK